MPLGLQLKVQDLSLPAGRSACNHKHHRPWRSKQPFHTNSKTYSIGDAKFPGRNYPPTTPPPPLVEDAKGGGGTTRSPNLANGFVLTNVDIEIVILCLSNGPWSARDGARGLWWTYGLGKQAASQLSNRIVGRPTGCPVASRSSILPYVPCFPTSFAPLRDMHVSTSKHYR